MLASIRAHGARLLGPNCLGISSAAVRLNATFASRAAPPGNIGFSSQSGALGLALLEATESRGLGLSAFVSIGNKADVSSNDLLEWWEDDPATEVVALSRVLRKSEALWDARPPCRADEANPWGKERNHGFRRTRGELAHCGACGSEAAVTCSSTRRGHPCDTLEELIHVATSAFDGTDAARPAGSSPNQRRWARNPLRGCLRGGRAGATAAHGGDGSSDHAATAEQASLANPVDMLGSASDASYEEVLPFLLADPGVDAVIALFVPAVSATAEAVASAIANACDAANGDKPVLAVVMSAEGIPKPLRAEHRVAAFGYPESAARALGRAAERADWLRRPLGPVPEIDGIDTEAALAVVARVLSGTDGRWLDPLRRASSCSPTGSHSCRDESRRPRRTPSRLRSKSSYPVVVKMAAPGAHKTETGGIALDLTSEEAVRAAVERIG